MLTCGVFFFQAEDGIRDLVRSRGLGDVYKRQRWSSAPAPLAAFKVTMDGDVIFSVTGAASGPYAGCLLYTSDAADERSSVDLGGRRIINKKNKHKSRVRRETYHLKNRTHQTTNQR